MAIRVSEGPKRALVTGAGARLGKAMAEALGEDGWSVAIHYRGSKTDRKSTRLNSSHQIISYAVFCLKKKKQKQTNKQKNNNKLFNTTYNIYIP